tara:strand:- start:1038 stop:1307 length:270 start_codon:yes stop_codon:yes gene_type:complete
MFNPQISQKVGKNTKSVVSFAVLLLAVGVVASYGGLFDSGDSLTGAAVSDEDTNIGSTIIAVLGIGAMLLVAVLLISLITWRIKKKWKK